MVRERGDGEGRGVMVSERVHITSSVHCALLSLWQCTTEHTHAHTTMTPEPIGGDRGGSSSSATLVLAVSPTESWAPAQSLCVPRRATQQYRFWPTWPLLPVSFLGGKTIGGATNGSGSGSWTSVWLWLFQ